MIRKVLLSLFIASSVSLSQIDRAQQLIIIVTSDWNSVTGSLYLFDMTETGWQQYNAPWKVNVGDSGMAWGIGLHEIPANGRIKREGDRRSPAGVFEMGDLYGYAATTPPGIRIPYIQSIRTLYCIDDSSSVFYNSVIDEQNVLRDSLGHLPWKSSEPMWMDSIDYKLALSIKHNPRALPGYGSCVFLHVVRNSIPPTLGCTSMEENQLLFLLQWYDPDKKPLLVQLPIAEFNKYLIAWNLPLLQKN